MLYFATGIIMFQTTFVRISLFIPDNTKKAVCVQMAGTHSFAANRQRPQATPPPPHVNSYYCVITRPKPPRGVARYMLPHGRMSPQNHRRIVQQYTVHTNTLQVLYLVIIRYRDFFFFKKKAQTLLIKQASAGNSRRRQ